MKFLAKVLRLFHRPDAQPFDTVAVMYAASLFGPYADR